MRGGQLWLTAHNCFWAVSEKGAGGHCSLEVCGASGGWVESLKPCHVGLGVCFFHFLKFKPYFQIIEGLMQFQK